VTGAIPEAGGTGGAPRAIDPSVADAPGAEPGREPVDAQPSAMSAVGDTRFAHASEAEMARILDFYGVRWEYEPTTFPILWNLDGDVVESFAPDFYLPELEVFLEMTTLKQRLVRKKNRKLRRIRELYPDIKIKLFYARDFRAMMLKYGRFGLFESLSGTTGQVIHERAATDVALAVTDPPIADLTADPEPAPIVRAAPRSRPGRRRRVIGGGIGTGAEREAGA
jgi:hypoxanthine phosphoribosyltransferase